MYRPLMRSRVHLAVAVTAANLLCSVQVKAETFALGIGATWNATTSWNPASIPSSVGAVAIFNNAETALNAPQTANRPVTLDGARVVGSLFFNNDAANGFTNSLTAGTGGALIFDEVDAGPATLFAQGFGTGNNAISAPITLNDSLVAYVDNISSTSAAGALNLTAEIAGSGGFTKYGDGTATFGTGAKTYTGATVLNGGRMRISQLAHPSATSSFTINFGAQLTPISGGVFAFGSGPLILNGNGPTAGPAAGFPGAIRPDTNLQVTINNAVVLQSTAVLHVQGAAGTLTLPNVVSGPGGLTFTAFPHDANLGTLILNGSNTYSGSTVVKGGTVRLSGSDASLGVSDVMVLSAHGSFAGASARVLIDAGVLNAIADSATLTLAGGGNQFGIPDDGYLELSGGVNETVGSLVLGGILQQPGTYGSTASDAMFKLDEYFSGTGILTVVPEPSAALVLVAGFGVLAAKRRRR